MPEGLTRVFSRFVPLLCVVGIAHDATVTFAEDQTLEPAVERALGYLAVQVPQWSVENKCFSCHNNGDAARAMFAARRKGMPVAREATEATLRWLGHPERWGNNGGQREFNDKKLATIQFAFALLAASESGDVNERPPLLRAAEMVSAWQQEDGSWKIHAQGTIGSPITYGNTLATAVARKILAADHERFKPKIAKADRWLRDQEPQNVLDAAGILIGLGASQNGRAIARQKQCLDLIRQAQRASGGWGPYSNSAAEPFDTAVVLLALQPFAEEEDRPGMIQRGRRFLIESQFDDGSWPETTRPANAESYAHRLSTTGWAVLALIETGPTK
jgi:hypothetical protein